MRIFLAVLAVAFVVGTAHAQTMGGMGGGRKGRGAQQNAAQQKADQQQRKAVDEAYQSAVKRIPDAKEKYDPWKNAR